MNSSRCLNLFNTCGPTPCCLEKILPTWSLKNFNSPGPYLSIPLDPSDSVLKLRRNMALQMFLGGAYITYWRPRYVSVHYMNLILRGYTLMLVDLVSHQLPFHFIFWQNDHPLLWTWWDRVWTNIPILLYWRFLGLWEYYRLENQDIFALFLLYVFFSFFL